MSRRELWRIEDGALKLAFHEGQKAAWESDKRFVAILAGTQGGKTSYGPWWLAREIRRRGRGDYLAASSTFDLFKLKMLPTIRDVFERILQSGRYWPSDRVLEVFDPEGNMPPAKHADGEMWARIILRAASAPGGLESATASGAWLDEWGQDEVGIEHWEAVRRRLSIMQGRALLTTTPYNLGWIKTHIFEPWQNGSDEFDVIQFASTSNPIFPAEELERAKATMPLWRFEMFYLGKFSKPAGLIYDCVDEDSYVDDFPVPEDWPLYLGVDFGSENTANVWIAEDQDTGIHYVIGESLRGGQTTREHCNMARAYAGRRDFLAWGGAPSEEQQRMDWNAEGVPVMRPMVDAVEAGILRVYSQLKPRKLKVFKGCTGLRREIDNYRRVLNDEGDPTELIADKSTFHRLDALRYVVSGYTGGKARFTESFW